MYTFINKNFCIPIIKNYNNKIDALIKLQYDTYLRDKKYNKNVYIFSKNENKSEIYYSDGEFIYCKNINNKLNIKPVIIYKYSNFNLLDTEYLLEYSENNQNIIFNDINKDENKDEMKLFIKNKINTKEENIQPVNNYLNKNIIEIINKENTIISEENNLTQEEIENKNKIIKLIEEVNDLYKNELLKISKLEQNIKLFDKKINKLEKKKEEENYNNVVKTYSDYKTWKKIKYIIKDDTDINKPIEKLELSNIPIPILFLSKYNYIDKIQENHEIKKIFDEINLIDLNNIYCNKILPNDNIIKFCNKYIKISKDLNYMFDHQWDYLDNEFNINSTNKMFL